MKRKSAGGAVPPRKASASHSEARATLKDVAADVGVHASTISRALNPETRDLVAEPLATRIVEAAQRLGYRPNRMAAGLRTKTSMTVMLVLSDIANATFPVLVHAIEKTLAKANYSLLVAHAETGYPHKSPLIDQLATRQIDGLIITTSRRHSEVIDFCLNADIPLVSVNRPETDSRISSVLNDDYAGSALAVDHVVELGHHRIGHVAGPHDMYSARARRESFENAMRGHKLEPAGIVRAKAYLREEGREAALSLLRSAPDITAIVTSNDFLAVGCLDAFRILGKRCPEDISVVGHNDMPLVDLISPGLTTVRVNNKQIGEEAAELMLRLLADPSGDPVTLTMRPKLIVRGSTAPPSKTRK